MKGKIKLFSASDLLRQGSPRKYGSNSNRFANLRDESPSAGNNSGRRFRSPSVKRKTDETVSYANVASSGLPQVTITNDNSQFLESLMVNTAKVTSLCEKVQGELVTLGAEPEICTIFTDLCEAVRCINDSQIRLAERQYGENAPSPTFSQVPSKRFKQTSNLGKPPTQLVDISTIIPTVQTVTETKEEGDRRRFKEIVKDAEKSTLIFNLNMGTVPIMNMETISKKATLALTAMAAQNEGKSTSTPSDEAVMAIDDVLSVTTGMSFFGNATKSYNNPRDKNSGAFCTLPVKYEFKDKDSRIRAETTLRARCKVSCTTPYPIILRECICRVVDKVKKDYPGEFVRVNVDTNKLCLNVARRGNKDTSWSYLKKDIALPLDVLDTVTRTVPKDMVIDYLTDNDIYFTPNKPERGRQPKKPSNMEGIETNE